MKVRRLGYLQLLVTLAALMVSIQSLTAEVLEKTKKVGNTELHYKVVLPKGYDATKAYPAILAFPGGPQTMDTVDGTLERNWRAQAERLGYIVIIPAAPGSDEDAGLGQLFFEGGAKVFPEFVIKLLADYKIESNKFHIAGVSNGGLSAFYIAASYPQYFWSVTGLPGFLIEATPARVRALSKLCINMYAGEMDPEWLQAERKQAADFRAQGFTVEFNEEKGQGHGMRTLEGEGAGRLFKQFEAARRGCGK